MHAHILKRLNCFKILFSEDSFCVCFLQGIQILTSFQYLNHGCIHDGSIKMHNASNVGYTR